MSRFFSGLRRLSQTAAGEKITSEQRQQLETRLAEAQRQAASATQQLEAFFGVSRKFAEAEDENEVIEPVLRLIVDLTAATAASFVPLDEHGLPQTVLSYGELPAEEMEKWLEYLASPGVHERCRADAPRAVFEAPPDCPLLKAPFASSQGLLCMPVRRGEREFGVLNVFLPDKSSLDEKTCTFLYAILDETALGLEDIYLRRREQMALRQMQVLRRRTDLSGLLTGLLENIFQTLEADFATIVVPRSGWYQDRTSLSLGDFPPQERGFIDGILQSVMSSTEPVFLDDVSGDPATTLLARPFLRSLIAVPLLSSERIPVGALLVGNRRPGGFHQRQMALIQTIAAQVALVVQNASMMAELEYQSTIQERARLAREIHDGLAQMIGFLKLQAAQLRSFLQQGDQERAIQNAEILYKTLSETYQDTRQAIDGLRISTDDCDLTGWLAQTADEFRSLSGMQVDLLANEIGAPVLPEIQAQLIRIVQEALSNVRKHSQARRVWIECRQTMDDLVLEVRDDGQGFSPEDISSPSRHGLRGMQERAELIGAGFDVISRPHEGTIVRVRWKLPEWEEAGS